MIDYSWVDRVNARCRCGAVGGWHWNGIQFVVDHSEHGGGTCTVIELTPREERELRMAKGRTGRLSERGKRPGRHP